MSEAESVQVVDSSGLTFRAWLKPALDDTGTAQVLLQLDDGTQFLVPSDMLSPEGEGHYVLHISLREYARNPDAAESLYVTSATSAETANPVGLDRDQTVIELAEETLKVSTRTLERGQVRVIKRVVEREETVDQPLMREEVTVERVPINQVVEQAAPVRYEGDTTIVPLFEEVLVVEKRLMLVEEVRVTRRQLERRDPQTVLLRREEAVIERDGAVVDTLEDDT